MQQQNPGLIGSGQDRRHHGKFGDAFGTRKWLKNIRV
jgi:hypothetical protein